MAINDKLDPTTARLPRPPSIAGLRPEEALMRLQAWTLQLILALEGNPFSYSPLTHKNMVLLIPTPSSTWGGAPPGWQRCNGNNGAPDFTASEFAGMNYIIRTW